MALKRNPKLNAKAITTTASDSWKASAFLNIYITKREGVRVRLGAIALRDSNAGESALLSWIDGNAEKASTLKDKFVLEFNGLNSDTDGFDFIDGLDTSATEETESDVMGFINISLPSKSGVSRLSSIALRHGNKNVETIAAWLAQDDENINILRTRLIVEYQSATSSKTTEWLLD